MIEFGVQKKGKVNLFIFKLKEEIDNKYDILFDCEKIYKYVDIYETQIIEGQKYLILEIDSFNYEKMDKNKYIYNDLLNKITINRVIYLNFIDKNITKEEYNYYTLMSDSCFQLKETEFNASIFLNELIQDVYLESYSENCYTDILDDKDNTNKLISLLNDNLIGYDFKKSIDCQDFIYSFYRT